ncbi:MAG TPA: GTPase [Pirellulales bacterium]|nr:GTPase [Pirellulales bacterium]
MQYDLRDTIVAVASPAGGGARGIVRLSGPAVLDLIARACQGLPNEPALAAGGSAVYRGTLRLTAWQRDLPTDVYLWPDRRSYTRQPAAELHTLGSPPLLAAAVEELCRHGARPAAPGEFTLRAFLAGRIDLTQAEAVLGVIDARGEAQLNTALAQLAGGLAGPLAALRDLLLDLLARLEAALDFAAEDIELITAAEIAAELSAAIERTGAVADQIGRRRASTDAVRIVLIGLPNAGKSSLFNALAGGRAIVSDQPGTTRDYLTAHSDFGGVSCELIDTAGIEAARDTIAFEAQRLSGEQTERAHITLLCIDGGVPAVADQVSPDRPSAEPENRIVVVTKHDLSASRERGFVAESRLIRSTVIETSVRTGYGLDVLRRRIGELAQQVSTPDGSSVAATAARAADSIRLAAEALARARSLNDHAGGEELIAAEIRLALDELGKVSGAVTTDDVLDRIFSRFCIGK